MHNSECKKSVHIVHQGGECLNWATKPVSDFAHDVTVAASDGAMLEYHEECAENVRAADTLPDPLVQSTRADKATAMFHEMVAATRHYQPEELTAGVAA